jgi:surface protein
MFEYSYGFNQPIGGWDTSLVQDMSGMFAFSVAFNQSIGCWETSLVAGRCRLTV